MRKMMCGLLVLMLLSAVIAVPGAALAIGGGNSGGDSSSGGSSNPGVIAEGTAKEFGSPNSTEPESSVLPEETVVETTEETYPEPTVPAAAAVTETAAAEETVAQTEPATEEAPKPETEEDPKPAETEETETIGFPVNLFIRNAEQAGEGQYLKMAVLALVSVGMLLPAFLPARKGGKAESASYGKTMYNAVTVIHTPADEKKKK